MALDTERQDTPVRATAAGHSRPAAALAGAAAAAAALGLAELAAGLLPAAPSLVLAVGAAVIDLVPPPVKDAAIAVFGVYDKVALVVGILVVAAAFGAAVGLAAARLPAVGVLGVAAFGVLGVVAAAGDPRTSVLLAAVVAAVGVAAGSGVLLWLVRALPDRLASPAEPGTSAAAGPRPDTTADRRRFLGMVAGVVAVAAFTAAGGRLLARRAATSAARAAVELPPPAEPAPAPPDGASFAIDGLSPLYTPNDDFYRIDTALSVPQVDPATWRLGVTGMVDRPLSLSYEDLLALPQVEVDVTLLCVSNEVGGDLVGNARWTGVRLADLLDRAGVRVGAGQVVGRSVDGWTAGFPTDAVLDGREAIVAVGMNGEPLPLRHGFPARLVVPGLYGYVSATKWLAEIELTTWEGFDAYWVPRGWSKEAPIKTQSRIDVPAARSRVPAGPTAIAGVAWGGLRGVSRVEVSVDDGPWQEADLAEPLSAVTWRQWRWRWDATAGRHRLRVRATDGEGAVQTAERSRPAPDGATGYHTVDVEVA